MQSGVFLGATQYFPYGDVAQAFGEQQLLFAQDWFRPAHAADIVGVLVGVFVGVFVGVLVGVFVGVLVGAFVGVFVGVLVGVFVGALVGVFVGVLVGALVSATHVQQLAPHSLLAE